MNIFCDRTRWLVSDDDESSILPRCPIIRYSEWCWSKRSNIVLGRNSPHENSSRDLTPSEWSDSSEEGNIPVGCRSIINPNYPGFQHLAPSLLSDNDLTEDEHDSCNDYPQLYRIHESPTKSGNEYNNNVDDSINHLCGQLNDRKIFYEKPKFNIQVISFVFWFNPEPEPI